MFLKEKRYIPEIAGPQKLRLGKSIFQAQTLIGLKLWLSSLFIVAVLFLFTLFIRSVIFFTG